MVFFIYICILKRKYMKFNYVLLLTLFSFTVYSQNNLEVQKILSSYDINKINELKINLQKIYNEREERKNLFLSTNLNFNKKFKLDNVSYELYDVVDSKPVFRSTDNYAAALATKTNTLYPGGSLGLSLTGNGMLIGVWDEEHALVTHQEFQLNGVSRVSTPDNTFSPIFDFHATHVVGTVGAKGVNSSARGMAYESTIKSYDWDNDESEVTSEVSDNALLLSNHSYGIPIYNSSGAQNAPDWMMGCYNSDAQTWDQMHFTMPYYLQVTSAGNSGTDSYVGGLSAGIDKLTGEKNAKNNLVVANANPSVHPITGVLQNLVINTSSSQGPADDGRIKPDIAADGTNLLSTSNASTTSYDTATGTSMASPGVAGSLLLLQQHYNNIFSNFMRSATLKGVVCHTAFDDSNIIGPDPYFGWGLLNANEAASVITNSNNTIPSATIEERSLGNGQTYSFNVVVSNPQKLKATLCWTDPAGTSRNGQLNSTTAALKHNLDLRIIKGAEINYPWKLQLSDITAPAIKGDNNVDNVEKVEVDNASGTYTIQVSHKGFIVGGSQAYSLIISGFDQNLSAIDFNLNKINIHPNPTTDKLFVNTSNVAVTQYEVFDLQGRLVKSDKVNNLTNFSIELNDINAGMYLVQIHSSNGISSHKIIKK
jgi:serine protease AprX